MGEWREPLGAMVVSYSQWGASRFEQIFSDSPRFIMVDLYPSGGPNMTGCLNADGLLDVTRCAEQIGIAPEESNFFRGPSV